MRRRTFRQITVTLILAAAAAVAQAAPPWAWNDHSAPYDFVFGNHIDTHQQTGIDKSGDLRGFFYIYFTGETDPDSGLPVARHPRGVSDSHDERCGITVDCVVGWLMSGKPGEAKFLYHSGVNGNDHPVWLVASRNDIPQPGVYSHFHWIGSDSSDSRAGSVPAECDTNSAGELEPDAVNVVCPGWFLQVEAIRSFAFMHGGEKLVVHAGDDLRTHLNIVSNYSAVEGVTGTGGGSGGGH